MSSNQMPPVPQGLREMLKDYPDHIDRVQQALNWVIENPSSGIPPFERAIWALEGRLETFISEARDELAIAIASSDTEAIAHAEKKELLMLHSRSWGNWRDENLMEYFGVPTTVVRHGG